jgi:hypothetical protein
MSGVDMSLSDTAPNIHPTGVELAEVNIGCGSTRWSNFRAARNKSSRFWPEA